MAKNKLLQSIPLILIAGLLIYAWAVISTTDIMATWRHFTALGLFLILILCYWKNSKLAIIGTGFYLILATLNLLSMTAVIRTNWIRIGPFTSPPIQLSSLGLLILFLILNFDTLTDMHFDYKESKKIKKNSLD